MQDQSLQDQDQDQYQFWFVWDRSCHKTEASDNINSTRLLTFAHDGQNRKSYLKTVNI